MREPSDRAAARELDVEDEVEGLSGRGVLGEDRETETEDTLWDCP